MKRFIRLTAFLFAAALLFVAAGCTKKEPAETGSAAGTSAETTAEKTASAETEAALSDGVYTAAVTLTGGTGRASVASPAKLTISGGSITATIVWSSSNYDYMIVDGEKILPLTTEGGSTFEIPVAALDTELPVIGDTTAMSVPHEIEYTLLFDSSTLTAEREEAP